MGRIMRRRFVLLACASLILALIAGSSVAIPQASATTLAFAKVTGSITDGLGAGVPSSQITLVDPGEDINGPSTVIRASATTNSDGSYTLFVRPGDYMFFVSYGVALSGQDLLQSVVAKVPLNVGGTTLQDVAYPSIIDAAAQVVDQTGAAFQVDPAHPVDSLPALLVEPVSTVTPLIGGVDAEFTIDGSYKSDGTVGQRIRAAADGTFSFGVFDGPRPRAKVRASVLGVMPWVADVQVADGDGTTQVQQPSSNLVAGVVADSAGLPVANAGIHISHAGSSDVALFGSDAVQRTDGAGSFSIWAPSGAYEVGVQRVESLPRIVTETAMTHVVLDGPASLAFAFPAVVSLQVSLGCLPSCPPVVWDVAPASLQRTVGGNEPVEYSLFGGWRSVSKAGTIPVAVQDCSEGRENAGECTLSSFRDASVLVTARPWGVAPIEASVTTTEASNALEVPYHSTTVPLSGTVRSDNGDVVTGARVRVTTASAQFDDLGTWFDNPWSSGGTYNFDLPPGRYKVMVELGYAAGVYSSHEVQLDTATTRDVLFPALVDVGVAVVDGMGSSVGSMSKVKLATAVTSSTDDTGHLYSFAIVGSGDGTFAGSGQSCFTSATGTCEFKSFVGANHVLIVTPNGAGPLAGSLSVTGSNTNVTIAVPYVVRVQSEGAVAGAVSIATEPGQQVSDAGVAQTSGLPNDTEAPVGIIAYTVTGVPVGGGVEATITLPDGSAPTAVYKVTSSGLVSAAEFSTIDGDTIVMYLTDGGPGDEDGVENGVIVDP
ncbi:MAG: hypothetical protein RJA70_3996, partial [Pseudomonadota bacterium]